MKAWRQFSPVPSPQYTYKTAIHNSSENTSRASEVKPERRVTEVIHWPAATPCYHTSVLISLSATVTKSRPTPLPLFPMKLLLGKCYGYSGYTMKAGGGTAFATQLVQTLYIVLIV